ncbi:hypothetical protein TcG_03282 [Trypanosoma cruzi]|nr:hypothetical protein TcG_03282 [Trypanosoma cruzi]
MNSSPTFPHNHAVYYILVRTAHSQQLLHDAIANELDPSLSFNMVVALSIILTALIIKVGTKNLQYDVLHIIRRDAADFHSVIVIRRLLRLLWISAVRVVMQPQTRVRHRRQGDIHFFWSAGCSSTALISGRVSAFSLLCVGIGGSTATSCADVSDGVSTDMKGSPLRSAQRKRNGRTFHIHQKREGGQPSKNK